jgi:Zn-dependent M28 family amino/carboxypeptidase
VVNLDMIGRDERPSKQTEGLIRIAEDTSNELNLIGLKNQPKLRALIERENRQAGLRLNDKWEDDAALSVLWRCDHFPFMLHEVPAVWLFNGFTPDYHQPTDTVEKLNFAKMRKIVRLAYRVGRALADQ